MSVDKQPEQEGAWGGAEIAGTIFVVVLMIGMVAAYTGLFKPW